MKYACCIFILFVSLKSYSQEFTNQWAALLSYVDVVDLAEGNDKLFAASENALFTYDLITGEITTINTIDGLSGDQISKVYYSENFDIILVGYQNGLVELVLEDGTTLAVVDILNKPTIPPDRKRINHFNEFNGNVYIATDFGISVYDLTGLEFGDTYFIGDFGAQNKVNQTAVIDGLIYAAMENKMKRADVNNPDLINFDQWVDFYPFGLIGVQAFGDFLYAIYFNSRLLRFEGNIATVVATFPQANRNIYTSDDFLTVTSLNRSTAFDLTMNQVASINNVLD
ncbi:MAG: ABC transporter substrate-binding protein, partial [Flavobacteriaceae bacterium]